MVNTRYGVVVKKMNTLGGQTLWREVKVAILARLEQGINSKGKPISQLHHRRLVAVLGDIETLKPRLWLEAKRLWVSGLNSSLASAMADGDRSDCIRNVSLRPVLGSWISTMGLKIFVRLLLRL